MSAPTTIAECDRRIAECKRKMRWIEVKMGACVIAFIVGTIGFAWASGWL